MGFEYSQLGDVCEILDRIRKPITKRDRVAGPYPYYGATGVLDYVEGYLFDEPLVLVGEDGAKWKAGENTAFPVYGKCWVNNHAHVLRPDRSRLLDSWLIYYLNLSDLTPFITGLTVPKLNQGKLREIPIPLSPLPEQERIVAILDEAFAAIATATANAEKNLANARELFEGERNHLFSQKGDGWSKKPLSDFVHEVATGPFGSILHKSDYIKGGIPVVNPVNIVEDTIVPDMRKTVGGEVLARLSKYSLFENDIVIARRGEIGRCAVVSSPESGWICGTGCFTIRPCAETNPFFLGHLLRSKKYRDRLKRKSGRATMPSLSNKQLAALPIRMPPLSEQEAIVSQVQAIDEAIRQLESLFTNKLALLAELKQSILHKAFTGELTADSKPADRALNEAGL